MDIIDKLKAYRLKHGLSQEELATKLEVRFVTVNRWFNNKDKKKIPNELNMFKIKKLLKIRK